MLDSLISAGRDLLSRTQLQRLRQQTAKEAKSNNASQKLRVHGWRWHHLGIIGHLSTLQTQAKKQKRGMCQPSNPSALTSRKEFLESVRFVLIDSWQLHNHVESKLFFPWISKRESTDAVAKKCLIIKKERDRLTAESAFVTKRVENWVDARTGNCEKEVDDIIHMLRKLQQKGSQLFQTSEVVILPHVLHLFSEKEQLKFNASVLKNLTGLQKRESLVVFSDALGPSQAKSSTHKDRKDFQRAVPSAVRRIVLPYWTKKLYAKKLRFLTGKAS